MTETVCESESVVAKTLMQLALGDGWRERPFGAVLWMLAKHRSFVLVSNLERREFLRHLIREVRDNRKKTGAAWDDAMQAMHGGWTKHALELAAYTAWGLSLRLPDRAGSFSAVNTTWEGRNGEEDGGC